jgi:hypothetical protein
MNLNIETKNQNESKSQSKTQAKSTTSNLPNAVAVPILNLIEMEQWKQKPNEQTKVTRKTKHARAGSIHCFNPIQRINAEYVET